MSEVSFPFKDIFQNEFDWDIQEDETDFIFGILDEIIEKAISAAENDEQPTINIAECIAISVLKEVINDVFSLHDDRKKILRPSSESESSSESSYHVPSYLAIRSQLEISEESIEEQHEHKCEQYEDVDQYASTVVDEILEKAAEYALKHGIGQIINEPESTEGSYASTNTIVEWPSIEAFSVEMGRNKIYEFMDTWDYDEDWLYCVDFLTQQSDDCSDYYKYEARWSIPTQMYPIPQATASIYFTIECSRVKPQHCPVNVTYVYEGTSFVHALESVFSEDRLFEIVDAKLKFYQRLTF